MGNANYEGEFNRPSRLDTDDEEENDTVAEIEDDNPSALSNINGIKIFAAFI